MLTRYLDSLGYPHVIRKLRLPKISWDSQTCVRSWGESGSKWSSISQNCRLTTLLIPRQECSLHKPYEYEYATLEPSKPHNPHDTHACTYICIYVYVCMCIYMLFFTYIHTYIHACIHAYMHTYVQVRSYVQPYNKHV